MLKEQNTLINAIHAKAKKVSLEPPQLVPSVAYKYSHYLESKTTFFHILCT